MRTAGRAPIGAMVCAALAAVMLCADTAQAEDWHWRRGAPSELATEHGGVGAELGFGGSRDRFGLSPLVGGWIVPADRLLLSLDWGAVFVRNGRRTRDVANPLLSALFVDETEGVRVEMGFQAGLPAARLRADSLAGLDEERVAHLLTAFLRGGWNVMMWVPEVLSGSLPLHAESLGGPTHLALDVGFAGGIVPEDAERWLVAVQAAGEIGYRDQWGAAGLRMQLVWLTGLAGQYLQSSLEPFLRVQMERAFVSVRATLNLDEPWGLAGRGARVWAAHGGVGSVF